MADCISVENKTRGKNNARTNHRYELSPCTSTKKKERKEKLEKALRTFSDTIFHYYFVHTLREYPKKIISFFWQKLKLHGFMNLCRVPAYTQNTFKKKLKPQGHYHKFSFHLSFCSFYTLISSFLAHMD